MIAIIKYNGGNVNSVQNALKRLNAESVITDDPEIIRKADKVIFPGVGEASSTMKILKQNGLDLLIPSLKQPVLGICLGMQLMCMNNERRADSSVGGCVGMGTEGGALALPLADAPSDTDAERTGRLRELVEGCCGCSGGGTGRGGGSGRRLYACRSFGSCLRLESLAS